MKKLLATIIILALGVYGVGKFIGGMRENTEVERTLAYAVLEGQQAHIAQAEAVQAQAEANQAMAEALKTQAVTHLAEQALVVLLVGMILGAGVAIMLFVVRWQQAEQRRRIGIIEAPGELWSWLAKEGMATPVEENEATFRNWGW